MSNLVGVLCKERTHYRLLVTDKPEHAESGGGLECMHVACRVLGTAHKKLGIERPTEIMKRMNNVIQNTTIANCTNQSREVTSS